MRRTLCGLLIACVFMLGACGGGKKTPTDNPNDVPTVDESLKVWDSKPPWPLADRQGDRIDAANLPSLKAEGSLVHYHSHLDVFDEGEAVTVPANVGIDFEEQAISPMHTHSDSGIIHIEADADEDFTIRQFLTEWGVRTTGDCIGDVCPPKPIELYVNGVKQAGPALDFVIKPNLQMALVLGAAPATIPATYDCSAHPTDACDKIPQP